MYLKGIKISLSVILINYYCMKIIIGNLLPYCSIICFGIMLTCLFLDIIQNRNGKVVIKSEFRLWIAYLAICLFTSLVCSNTFGIMLDLVDYIQRIVVAYSVYYVCSSEQSIKWPINLITLVSIVAAVSIICNTSDFGRRLGSEGSASEAVSANDIGALMAFGCFTIFFAFNNKSRISFIRMVLVAAISILFITVISISGSRKAIIAVIILYVCLILLCTKSVFKSISSTQLFLITAAVLGVLVLAYMYLLPLFENTSLYMRVFGDKAVGASQSNDGRMWLIELALKDFLEHPIIGLGYNNFAYYHGNYTHCTYVEPLASSGIWGVLYLIPYISILKKGIFISRHSAENVILKKALLAFYFSFLFVGVGIPFIYKDVPNVVLGMFLGAQEIGLGELYKNWR